MSDKGDGKNDKTSDTYVRSSSTACLMALWAGPLATMSYKNATETNENASINILADVTLK
jgi:hypothetical protein